MKKNLCVFAIFTLFAFVFVSCADGIKGSYSGDSIGSSSGSSSSSSGSSSGRYTSVSGGTYVYPGWKFVFNKDGTVIMDDAFTYNWKSSGKIITVYQVIYGSSYTLYTFTANSTFTTIDYSGITLTRQ